MLTGCQWTPWPCGQLEALLPQPAIHGILHRHPALQVGSLPLSLEMARDLWGNRGRMCNLIVWMARVMVVMGIVVMVTVMVIMVVMVISWW